MTRRRRQTDGLAAQRQDAVRILGVNNDTIEKKSNHLISHRAGVCPLCSKMSRHVKVTSDLHSGIGSYPELAVVLEGGTARNRKKTSTETQMLGYTSLAKNKTNQ